MSLKVAAQAALKDPQDFRVLNSILLDRMQFMRQAGITFDGKRDTYTILGYLRTLTSKDYHDRYYRGGVAGRVVDALPKATWRSEMWVEENDDPKKLTPFEKQWEDLQEQFDLQTLFLRVDILSQLSSFAVLLIGTLGDDENLDQPLPKGKPGNLLYIEPFGGGGSIGQSQNNHVVSNMDGDAIIKELDTDVTSKRFGKPLFYQLRRVDINSPGLQKPVHWSRVIHIAEGCLDNDIYGEPALQRVWNLLDDLEKVTGGGAEAHWLRANQGLHLDIDKAMDLSPEEKAALKEQAEAYQHQIRRMLRTRGVSVNPLGSDVSDFGGNADALLTQIAGAKAIPKRILTGSEMGELASSQDRENWKDQIVGRQNGYAGPYIVKRFADRLIEYGYLVKPAQFTVKWSQIQTLTEDEKAAGAMKWASVNKQQGEIVFTNDEIRDHWYGMLPLTTEEKKPPMPVAPPKPPTSGEFPRAAEESAEEELIRVLADAIETGNMPVIEKLIGLGGPGSGHHGHEGRPGEVGGSVPSLANRPASPTGWAPLGITQRESDDKVKTSKQWSWNPRLSVHPPTDLPTDINNWMKYKGKVPLTEGQVEKLHLALHKIEAIYRDPEISGPLYDVLSSNNSPTGLKELLDKFHETGVLEDIPQISRTHPHEKYGRKPAKPPRSVPFSAGWTGPSRAELAKQAELAKLQLKAGAQDKLGAALDTLREQISDPDIGNILLEFLFDVFTGQWPVKQS